MIYTTGSILEEVYDAVEMLKQENISACLVNVVCLKPFNKEELIKKQKNYKMIFTVEEHNIYGGLGTIIAETLAYEGIGKKVCPIGLNDTFAITYSNYKNVRKANKLDAKSIYSKIKEVFVNYIN